MGRARVVDTVVLPVGHSRGKQKLHNNTIVLRA